MLKLLITCMILAFTSNLYALAPWKEADINYTYCSPGPDRIRALTGPTSFNPEPPIYVPTDQMIAEVRDMIEDDERLIKGIDRFVGFLNDYEELKKTVKDQNQLPSYFKDLDNVDISEEMLKEWELDKESNQKFEEEIRENLEHLMEHIQDYKEALNALNDTAGLNEYLRDLDDIEGTEQLMSEWLGSKKSTERSA